MSTPDLDDLTALASRDPARAVAVLEQARRAGTATAAQLYLHAQLLSRQGAHEEALVLIDAADAAFRQRGDEMGAARCDAGRSNVLQDLGRHVDAVDAARRWLSWLERTSTRTDPHVGLLAQARSNVGVHLEDAGDYVGALEAHDAAIAAMLAEGDEETAASVQVNRANVLNLLGRSPEALRALVWSAAVLEQVDDDDELAVVAINAGESLCRMGRPDEGLEWFARADRLIPQDSSERAVLLVETADAFAAIGALEEAARRYSDAFEALARTPLAWLEARAWTGTARVAAGLGRAAEAAEALTEASGRHLATGNQPGWAVTESEALVLLPPDEPGRSDRVAALVEVVGEIDDVRWPVQACQVRLNLAALPEGSFEAEVHLRAALGLAETSGVPHLVVGAGQRLGELLWRTGRASEASDVLERVLGVADGVRGRLHADELLRSFPITVEAAHDTLVQVRLGAGRIDDAFELADAGRSRAVVELGVADPSATAGAGAPDDNASDNDDDIDGELGAIYDRLLARDHPVSTELRLELDERVRRLDARLDRVALSAGDRPRRHRAAGLPPVADGEMQLLYQIADGQIGVFVRRGDGIVFHPGIADAAAVADDLAAFHSVGRRSLAVTDGSGDRFVQLAASADARLRRLGTHLLEPLGADLDQASRLVVVPHRGLHGVPFHALVVDGQAVLDRVDVTVTPSLGVRANRPPDRVGPTLLVGCGGADLPGVDAELATLAALLPDVIVLRDQQATVAAVTAAMAGAGCIHLASHGIFRRNAPMSSGIRLADGWLTARHITGLDLAGTTVVLSACDTGRSVVNAGEEMIGLQRGFLLAGARAVVMTHWPAIDEAALTTTTGFHAGRGAGLPVPAALRAAWIATRDRFPHPWWWAPFFAAA